MKKFLLTILAVMALVSAKASSVFYDSFEYANHDGESPIGWTCDDNSWLCGHLDKDHHRTAHTGEWYVYTNADESWMFMPMFMSTELKYRYSCWAISDGTYTLEFWAGNEASATGMSQLLFTTTVSNGNYALVSEYIQQINANYTHFGIHAVADEGAFHLTIDDVNVDMVEKYDFIATPSSADTVLYPGTQACYHFKVQDLGYEPLDVILSPSHEYFSDIHFTVEGEPCTVFHLEPEEVKEVIATATLPETATPGSTCWLDIMLVLDCNCATSMTTLWVTVLDATGVEEIKEPSIYPNPASDFVWINGEGLQRVDVMDATGRTVLSVPAEKEEVRLDCDGLASGVYFIRTVTPQGISVQKIIKEGK